MKFKTIITGCISAAVMLTQTPAMAQHGKVYGTKPATAEVIEASKLESFMSGKTAISTSVKGKVLKVTNAKNGWFTIDAGNGKVITAHFKNTGISLPGDIAGKTVVVEGTASKQFNADDKQHYVNGTGNNKAGGKGGIAIAVTGLEVK